MDAAYLDQAVSDLHDHRTEWARLPVGERIEHLTRLRAATGRVARSWVEAAVKAKGLSMDSPLSGEEWTSGPYALASGINALEETLVRIRDGRGVLDGYRVRTRPDGQVAVRVFPVSAQDRLFLSGHTAEVWMLPGVTERTLPGTVAHFYRKAAPEGAVSLILGAGNISSIPPLDLLYRMFVHGDVAIVKLNPVSEYLGEFFEEIFAPMVDAGWVRFAYGGGDVGSYLAYHDAVANIHITGGAHTHDAIVFGRGDEAIANKKANQAILGKPMTSELGGVGPTIVVPGRWTDADLHHQAAHIVTQKLHNSGFNCVASQVIVLPKHWDQADALLDAIVGVIESLPGRDAYYPGTERRLLDAIAAHPEAEIVSFGDGTVPLIRDVDPDGPNRYCFTHEFFGPVLATTRLPGDSPAEFLANAVAFSNHALAGTLGAGILIDPATARANAATLERAVADLEYGTVAVNTWTAVGYAMPRATWGGFPGATLRSIDSGIGVVHNALMFDQAQKTVVTGAFTPFPRSLGRGERHTEPKPPAFVTNRSAAIVGERLTRQAVSGKWRDLPGIVTAAMRG